MASITPESNIPSIPKPPDPPVLAASDHVSGANASDCPSSESRRNMSYASAVAGSPVNPVRHSLTLRFPPLSLPTRQVSSKEGRPAISFTSAEISACAKRYKFSLIAKFTIGRPMISEIKAAFQQAWRITGRATISEVWDARHVLIIMDSEADVRTALSSPLHKIGHAFFRLFRWNPDYNPKKESKFATTWIRLPGIPLTLYDPSFIEAIVSTFGYFVVVDDRTKACVAVKYARACVELDVTIPIPYSVWISLPKDNGYWQTIECESNLRYCNKCRVHGHSLTNCRKAKDARPKNQEASRTNPPKANRLREVKLGDSQTVSVTRPGNNQKDAAMPEQSISKDQSQGKAPVGEQWVEVISKKGSKKGAKTGVTSLSKSEEFAPVVEKDATDPLAMVVFSGESAVKDQANPQVTSMQHGPAGPLGSSVLSSQPRKVPNDLSGAELWLKSGKSSFTSSQVLYDDKHGRLVHSAGIEHFNQIQEKAGAVSMIIETSNLSDNFDCPKGSEHCLPSESL